MMVMVREARLEWLEKCEDLLKTVAGLSKCKKCGSPVTTTHKCFFCGDYNPSTTKEEDEEFEKKTDFKKNNS